MTEVVVEKDVLEDSARNINWQYYEALPLDGIRPSSFNPRKEFDSASLKKLAQSMRKNGVVQPIAVRALPEFMEIVCGERRYRAAKLAGLEVIPARVAHNMSDEQALEIAIIENLQRKDINAEEQARGFQALRDLGYSVKEIAEQVGCSESAVSNSTRLLELPAEMLKNITKQGPFTQSHAKALLPFVSSPLMSGLYAAIVQHGMKSKAVESLDLSSIPYSAASPIREHLRELGSWSCKFSPDQKCQGCATRVKRYCLDSECWDRNIAEAEQFAKEELAAKLEAADASDTVNLDDYRGVWSWVDVDAMCCGADCPNLKLANDYKGDPRTICIDKKCLREREAERERILTAERNAAREALIARSLNVMYHDPDAAHKLRVLAVCGSIRRQSTSFVIDMENAARRMGLSIDFGKLKKYCTESYNDNGLRAILEALYEIPAEQLVAIIAEAELYNESSNGRKKVMNDWFCGEPFEVPEGQAESLEQKTEISEGNAHGGAVESSTGDGVCPHDDHACEYYESCVGSRCDRWEPDQGTDGAEGTGDLSPCPSPEKGGETVAAGGRLVESLDDGAADVWAEAELKKAVGHIVNTSVEDGFGAIARCGDLDVLAAAREREAGGTKRKSLIKAIDARIKKLEKGGVKL